MIRRENIIMFSRVFKGKICVGNNNIIKQEYITEFLNILRSRHIKIKFPITNYYIIILPVALQLFIEKQDEMFL